MSLHYALGILLTLLAPLVVGVAVFAAGRRGHVPAWASLSIACVGGLFAFLLTGAGSIRCANSYDVRLAADELLSADELKTLRATQFFCPTVFKFRRDGKDSCLVSDTEGGGHIGCG